MPARLEPARTIPPRRRLKRSEGRITVAILSRNRRLYSTRRLVEATRALGHDAKVLDTLRCNLVLARDRPRIFYKGAEVREIGVVIPRIGASITGYGLSVVNQFDMMGVPVLNNSIPIARARDKLRALQLLSRFGIDIPRTVMCRYRDEVPLAVEQVGGLPCIMKLIQGAQGVGVLIASSMGEAEGMLDTLWTLGQEILLQELVAESRGRDVRALVVGDRVVAAMRRTARAGDFRSNIHRGGIAEAVTLEREYAEAAVKATRVMGLEAAAGVDIATLYVEHAAELARARLAPAAGGHLG